MNSNNIIPDVYLLSLERGEGRLVILRESDHLLRRFGQVEYRKLGKGKKTHFSLREVADEIWGLITGEATLTLVDKRPGSPSEDQSMRFDLTESLAQAVLVPFGVAYQINAIKDTQLIRISTHPDGTHSEDRDLSQDEIDGAHTSP